MSVGDLIPLPFDESGDLIHEGHLPRWRVVTVASHWHKVTEARAVVKYHGRGDATA